MDQDFICKPQYCGVISSQPVCSRWIHFKGVVNRLPAGEENGGKSPERAHLS